MKEDTHSFWEDFLTHCERNLGISRKILDLISISSILDLSVRGFSNKHIANHLELDERYVRNILESTMGFSGLKTDSESSPLFLYQKLTTVEFENQFKQHLENDKQTKNLLAFCKKYKEIERQLDEYYGD